MSDHSPNFLTCPAFEKSPEPPAPPPKPAHTPPKPPAPPKEKAPEPEREPRRRRPWGRVIVFLFVIGFLAITVVPAMALTQAYFAAQTMKTALNQARAHGSAQRFDLVLEDLEQARASATDLREALRRVGFWRDMPWIGTQLRGLEDAAAAGMGTLDGAEDIVRAFQAITDAMRGGVEATGELQTGIAPTRRFADLSPDEKRTLFAKFNDALPDLRLARDKIDAALVLWERVPQDKLAGPIRTALKPLADNLPTLKRTLDEAIPLVEVAVPLSGYPYPRRYLAFLQNSDEIRPSGGFIGNVGTMTFDAGDLTEFNFEDVYTIDNPVVPVWKEVAPEPMRKYLKVPAWYMRDANWSPDFSVSAERVLDFYIRERAAAGHPEKNPPTTVLALGPGLFKGLLRITGPITAQGITFNSENFFDTLEYEVEIGFLKKGIPVDKRKDLMKEIGDKMVERLKQLPSSRWPEVFDLLTQALERKQIMAYSRDRELMSLLDTRGWTGRVKGTNGDYLQVVDANLAALKTDGVMDKNISYTLDARDPQHPKATVTLTYINTNRAITWRYTRYRSYTRVYVPEGSRLISSTGAMQTDKVGGGQVDVMKELGKTVFGAFWSIEPGRTGTLSFTYELPPSVLSECGQYHLDLPKQSGVDDGGISLALTFKDAVKTAVPAEPKEKWGDNRYEIETTTLTDRAFDIGAPGCKASN